MISFVIPGEPVPQGRPRVTKAGCVYYDAKTKDYREKVKQCAMMAQNGRDGLTGALVMICDFTYRPPDSWPKNRRQEAITGKWHTGRKDTDNLCKSIADSCNGICYDDDSQIAVLIGTKQYGTEAQAKVTIMELNDIQNPSWMVANIKRTVEAGAV